MDSNTQYLQFVFYFSILANALGKKISWSKDFEQTFNVYLYSSRLGELTKAKLWKNCQCIVAITAPHNNNVVNMKKAFLDNENIRDRIEFWVLWTKNAMIEALLNYYQNAIHIHMHNNISTIMSLVVLSSCSFFSSSSFAVIPSRIITRCYF
jgi:hypothetical protein